ncbi:HAD family phosphatase [Paratractidigestivibacter sp.]|uniref:HAD family hydrolase n=1 Tax=Paratractidigestivibacter sp. TaxID=2847316 RepID=UPI002ABE9E38|nr:HAD family phosphatase [Paratractidigestivibacter sp.]
MSNPVSLWPASFDYAIFDFDGTLSATEQLWEKVDRAFFSSRGIEYTPAVHQTLATLGFTGGAHWVREEFGVRDSVKDICDEWNRMGAALYASETVLRPGAEDYLRALRAAGVPLALATTNDPQVLASMEPRVRVRELFDAVVCGKEVGKSKDHPDIYLEAARRIGADPARTIVFEDIVAGTRSAKSAGFITCAVGCTDPLQPVETLRAEADLWLEGWDEIPLG